MSILERRPFPNVEALAFVLAEGRTDSSARSLLSTHGPNRFNLNSAPLAVLKCVDGVGPHGVLAITLARSRHRTFVSVAELVDELPIAIRIQYERLTDLLTVSPPEGAIVVDGYAGVPPMRARTVFIVRLRGTDVDLLRVEEE